ncbi:MAG: SpoIID/LytB domain-containing protein [Atribacterota bacterium]|nr:SpoIID/LytB domain-containing protein [Atribacterota bacterium]
MTDKEKEMTVSSILREERDFSIQELISLLKRSQEQKELKTPVKKENIEINQQVNISYNISGKGSGHGVGLSQWGAYGMAEQGYKYEEILKYYYQGIDLIKIY